MFKFKTWRDPYGDGYTTFAKEVVLKEGVTVLVGCNGSGKTTLLRNIKDVVNEQKIPCYYYDNLQDGGSKSYYALLESDDIGGLSSRLSSSEGENIMLNVGDIAKNLRKFIHTGENMSNTAFARLVRLVHCDDKPQKVGNQRFILLDGVDSGCSIDNVIDLKDLFDVVMEEATQIGVEVYIVISANEYELVDGSECLDVTTGKPIAFNGYEDYKKYILKTRKKKEKRYEKINQKNAKEK